MDGAPSAVDVWFRQLTKSLFDIPPTIYDITRTILTRVMCLSHENALVEGLL